MPHLASSNVEIIPRKYNKSTKLDALSTVDDHVRAVDEASLIGRQVEAHVGDVVHLRQAAQGHLPDKLLPVLGRVWQAGEHGEKARGAEERADGVDADVVGAVFGRETLGGL